MPRTVDEGFRDFLSRLTPSDSETELARSHRASIEASLKANFGLRRFFRIGSFGNGTSISGYSDVDYLASFPTDQLNRSSSYSLQKIRNSLDSRFPSTNVHVDCPAIVVPFGTLASESTEIVPGDLLSTEGQHFIYDIPDCSGGWMRASPEAHIEYVKEIDERLNHKVKPLIRFVKAWKYFRSVPISSFYLELQVAKYCSTEPAIVYRIDLYKIFELLWETDLRSMVDPKGISGYIAACKSEAQKEDALSKTLTAFVRAEKANTSAVNEDIKDAFEWWTLLFGDRFPTYYR
jgi:hypothetical protein